jgi:uncharacterized protein
MEARYRVTNTTRNTLLGDGVTKASTFSQRFKGLMGQSTLPLGTGLLIAPCNSIHTFFMKIDIDVLFLAQDFTVVEVVHSLVPWRVSKYYPAAKQVLELPSGCARLSQTMPGDTLLFDRVA